MRDKTLYIIGDQQTVNFFRLLGAEGIVVESEAELETAEQELTSKVKQIGGILINNYLTLKPSKTMDRINRLGVPLITIPDQDQSGTNNNRLQVLMEKAIGMKMEQVSNPKESA